ncbi:MAG: sialate O-acetylesterase, partial [Planctomycetota bacterium]
HRNMEGERAFVQDLKKLDASLLKDDETIAFKYSLGGGYKDSAGWEPLGPAGYYDTFGPELSFAAELKKKVRGNIAIAKFTHSGSQIIDWTPEGSPAKTRHIYHNFLDFVRKSVKELEGRGHEVELAGIFYHVGENDMSFYPYRKDAPGRLANLAQKSRKDLERPELKWYLSQQPPTDDKRVNKVDVTAGIEKIAAEDPLLFHVKAFDLPKQEKKLVIDTAGIVELGRVIARGFSDK